MMKNNPVIIISGPTASGKTSLSIELARKINAEIINFDSLLFYKELNIGTAKPTQKEMENIPHFLVGNCSIKNPMNAAEFMKKAIPIINDCHSRNKAVILVGGSGFYLQAIQNGMYNSTTTSKELIEKSNKLYLNEGIIPFREYLEINDLESFEKYHINDHYRVRRAVEHHWMTGIKFSTSREQMKDRIQNSPAKQYGWNLMDNFFDIPKEEHFEIIKKRTLQMLEDGLIDEVQSLLNEGYTGDEKPLKSIGYKETISYIKGEFEHYDAYVEKININTRRLAKSQRTWFKKKVTNKYHSLIDKEAFFEDCRKFLE